MSLSELIQIKEERKKQDKVIIDEETLRRHLPQMRKIISFWRMYPDRFVDFLCSCNPRNGFKLYAYQRVFLRGVVRHRHCYMVFPRGYSKSFMCVLAYIIRAILYPRAKLFMVSGVKEQSASILSSKFTELCTLIPAISNEVIWDTRGTANKTVQTKDTVKFSFKNGSFLQNIPATQSTRGQRFNSGIMEECVSIDQTILQEVLIPTMNVDRQVNNTFDPNEMLNRAQAFVKLCDVIR